MASVRLLKKRIQAVTSDLLTDAILLSLFIDKDKMSELQDLAADLSMLEQRMLERANKPRDNKESAKEYYATMKKELSEEWCKIYDKLKELSQHVGKDEESAD